MKSTKRIVSLILAFVILFGTIGWIVGMVVGAAPTEGVTYLLDKVYSTGSSTATFDNYLQYDRTNTSRYPNFTINSGYSASFSITVVDSSYTSTTAPTNLSAVADNGSFSFIRTTDGKDISSIKISDVKADGKALSYKIYADKLRYSGDGKALGVTVSGDNGYTGNISLDVTQCKPYEPTPPSSGGSDDDDSAKPKSATPYLIVSNYNYGKDIAAGQTFNLSITCLNTSTKTDIENVVLTLTMPEGLALTSSSNTFYFANIDAEKTITKTVEVQAKPNAKPESQQIKVDFKYEYLADSARESVTTSETIAIPVTQPDRFTADPIQMPPQIMAGEEVPVSFNYVNKGRGEIYNVSAEITGNIANPGQRQNLGNLEAGKSGSVDFYITCNEPGTLNGNVTITYEDVNMIIKTVTVPFSAEVMSFEDTMGPGIGPMPGEDPTMPEGEEQGKSWGKYVVIGGAVVVVAGIVAVIVIKKKKAAKLAADEEEEDNED